MLGAKPFRRFFASFAMMLKRWSHILLVGWLINALICFHPAFGEDARVLPQHLTQASHHNDNTLLDIIVHHFVGQKSHKKSTHGKISTRSRYMSTRAISLNFVVPQTIIFDLVGQLQLLFCDQLKFWETKVFLPPLHHFLFRLSPF